jgi:1-acyl-sn-glycerol-3-phosphate acyltransferase
MLKLDRGATPPSLLERIKRHLALYWCVGVLGLGTFLWTPVAALLRLVLPRRLGHRVGRAAARLFFAFYLANLRATGYARIDLDGLASMEGERGIIVAANHPSLLDALMLLSRLPEGVPLMKADLERSVFWGAPAHLAGYISNRNIMEAVRVARERLHDGAQLVVFPEGTRTSPWPLGALRGAIAIIAQRAQAPVQTVIIETDSLFLSKGWPLWKVPPLPLHIRVRLGRRFGPPSDAPRFMVELREHFEQELARAELRPPVGETFERT